MESGLSLNGLRVLIVEDEYLLADELKCTLERAGASIIGPAGTSEAACKLIEREKFHLAVLDINLHGVRIYPLARLLLEKNIPFVFMSGYEHSTIPPELMYIEYLEKPVSAEDVLGAVAKAMQRPAQLCR